MRPIYNITVDGKTININERFISLRTTDESGMTADMLELVTSDHDNAVTLPPRNAAISAAIGIEDHQNPNNHTGLINKGKFIVDEISHSGPPDQITILARSADFRESLKTQHTQSYHDTTLGDILNTLAARNGLTPAIDPALASVVVPHLDQTNESDINLATRLGQLYDAVATIKTGNLLFTARGTGKTASGQQLPTITINRGETDRHDYRESDRESRYSGVTAKWHDPANKKTQTVTAGASGYTRTLRHKFADQTTAQKAAHAEWRRIQRAEITANITLAIGNPNVIAESPVQLSGYPASMDNVKWIAARVEHSITDSGGYSVSVELEQKI